MEFLVAIEIVVPDDLDEQRRRALTKAEAERAKALVEEGMLLRLWRVPGRTANWGLWQAADATALHAALESLPLWRWMDIEVHPLAAHPNDPQADR